MIPANRMHRSALNPDSRWLRRTLLFVGFSFAWAFQSVRAAHYSGGSLTYQCLGGNQYLVTLDLFVDCSGVAPIPQTINFASDCGTSFSVANLPVPAGTEVSQLCAASIANSTCNGGALPGIQHFQYQTVVNLGACDDWTMSWSICCRNNTVNLSGTPGMYIEATLANATAPCNNSPVFTDQSIPYVCVNQTVNYNYGVTEPDGNTLVYSLIDARYAAPNPTPVVYAGAYSGGNPVNGATLDPNTGQLTFFPTVQGNYVITVLVEEYDSNGNLIGSVMRDQMFVVLNCTGQTPTTSGLSNNTGGTITSANSILVCDGEAFCVDVTFTDPDPGTTLTITTNATNLLPGSVLNVTGTNPAVATICWTGDVNFSPVNVYVQASDGSCPLENVVSTSVNITSSPGGGPPPNAGLDALVASCESGAIIDLFGQLGGAPDAGGTWTDPGNLVHNGMFDPASDPAGAYVYSVSNGCLTAFAQVTVAINAAPDAGIDGNSNLCESSAPINLLAQLGGTPDAGGAWSGPSPVVGGQYDPATMTPGVYTYTVTGT
ncbi:MAG: hypothetical protein KDB97_07800, partial [Flavobacteriales bacterium]|nr:hypothetical protein [Flavobacteriales bacterium]